MNINVYRMSIANLAAALLVVACTGQASAQVGYGLHTYHPDHGYIPAAGALGYGAAGYGALGGYNLGTAGPGVGAGAAAAGVGQAAAGIGDYEVSHAQAQQAHQQAVSEYLKNEGLAQEEGLQMQQRQQQAQVEYNETEKAAAIEKVNLYKKSLENMSAEHRLTAEQFDFSTNVLHWPMVLRAPEYDEMRHKIDQLYDSRTPDDSGVNSSSYSGIQQACQDMLKVVMQGVRKGMPISDYVTAKHFISSVEYEAGFKAKAGK